MAADRTVRVWDILVRAGHWLLVAGVVMGWFTRHGGGAWHEYIGYCCLLVVVVRAAWGFTGSKYARFSQFLRSPSYTLAYGRAVLSATARRYVGHNPLAAWMSVSLLLLVFGVCASGWLYTTDRFWGVEWVEDLHAALTYVLLGLAALHVLGVIHTSRRIRENLVLGMIHGRKRAPEGDDID